MYNQNISKIKNWEVNINASPWYNSTNKDRDTAFISSLPSPQLTLFTSHSFSFAALSLSLSHFSLSTKKEESRRKMGCIMVMELGKKEKKLMRSILWRIRREIKKMKKKMKSPRDKNKKQTSFNYDPLSYSLNFDSL